MQQKEVLVIRIGLSIEHAKGSSVTVVVEPEEVSAGSSRSAEVASPLSNQKSVPRPGRCGEDHGSREPPGRSAGVMTDTQRKALFRIAFALGDKESALARILEALGVKHLELATKAQASKAITLLDARRKGIAGRSQGTSHA